MSDKEEEHILNFIDWYGSWEAPRPLDWYSTSEILDQYKLANDIK